MIANYENAVIELIKLLQIDSVESPPLAGMPFGKGNAIALEYTLDLLEKFGFAVKNIENYCGWGEIGQGELFGVLGHLDVVPVGNDWDFPPFGATINDNKIYARGAMDDKGPVMAAIFACAKLLQEGLVPKKRIRFILGCDEESGWKCMDRYAETEEMPVMGFSPDADFPVINCEKGLVLHEISLPLPPSIKSLKGGNRANMVPDYAEITLKDDKMIKSLAKSQGIKVVEEGEYMTLTATGISAHASCPTDGKNALTLLLGTLGIKYPTLNQIYAVFSQNDGSGVGLKLSDEQSGELTLNLGTVTTTGDALVFGLDIRHPISYKKDELTKILAKNLDFATVEQTFHHDPLYVAPDNPLVVKLLEAYDSVMGTVSQPITIGGGTYARFLPLGVAFGPQFPDTPTTIHQKNEYIDLDEYKTMIEIYYRALKSLCFE